MMLPTGHILRFKGRNASANCDEWEAGLRHSCKREGDTLLIVRPVDLFVGKTLSLEAMTIRAPDFLEYGPNGQSSAKPSGRTLGAPRS